MKNNHWDTLTHAADPGAQVTEPEFRIGIPPAASACETKLAQSFSYLSKAGFEQLAPLQAYFFA